MYPVLFGNQKLQLIQALLEVGDRKRASMLIDRMPANLPASFEAISKVMCSHLHQMIAPLYLPFSPRAKFGAGLQEFQGKALSYEWPSHVPVQTVSTFEDFLKGSNGVFPLLLALGPFIGRDPILQTKVARVVKAFIEKVRLSLTDSLNVLFSLIVEKREEHIVLDAHGRDGSCRWHVPSAIARPPAQQSRSGLAALGGRAAASLPHPLSPLFRVAHRRSRQQPRHGPCQGKHCQRHSQNPEV